MEQSQGFNMPEREPNRNREVQAKKEAGRALAEHQSRVAQVERAKRLIAARASIEYDWRDMALCSAADPKLFDNPKTQANKALAGAFCGACTVREDCAAFGKTVPGSGGLVWGGKLGKTNLIPR